MDYIAFEELPGEGTTIYLQLYFSEKVLDFKQITISHYVLPLSF